MTSVICRFVVSMADLPNVVSGDQSSGRRGWFILWGTAAAAMGTIRNWSAVDRTSGVVDQYSWALMNILLFG